MPPASKKKKAQKPEESDTEDQEEPQPGPSRMPPPSAVPKRRGYICGLCRKGFYELEVLKEHKRTIHHVTPSVITVAPDAVSLNSEDVASPEAEEEEYTRPSEAAPASRRSNRINVTAGPAHKEAAINPAKLPRQPKTRNELPLAINNPELAANGKRNRNRKHPGV